MKILIIVLISLLVFVYLTQYFKVNKDFEIIQVNISHLTPDLLFEKSPIIVNERIVDPKQLLQTVFKYLFLKNKESIAEVKKQNVCFGKYTILQDSKKDNIVNVIHPKNKNKNKKIKLYQNQCMILPMYWKYQPESELKVIHLCDIFSVFKN